MSAQRVKFRLQEERYSCSGPPSSASNSHTARVQRPSAPNVSTDDETAMMAAHRSSCSGGTSSSLLKSSDDGNWRKPGKMYRNRIVAQDEKEGGGKSFRISNQCAIDRYYQVADKVQYQFLNHPVDTKDEFVEAYLVGTRLCKFLSQVLPTHIEYFSKDPKLVNLRVASQAQLAELLPYLDQLERVIDEDEHQQYISQVLGTDDDDWEDVEEEDDALLQQQHQQQQNQQHQELQKDTSCVNTTMTSYEWTRNNPNDNSLDMDLILDGSNSLIDSFISEDLPARQQPQIQAQPTRQPPLMASLRPPPHPPAPSLETPRRSPSPSLRTSSSRQLESPSQRTAAVNWDTAWQRTTLQQSSPKQQQQQQQNNNDPAVVQDSNWQEEDSGWNPPVTTLQERVSELSPVRPLRVLRDEKQQQQQQQQQQQHRQPNVASMDESSQDRPARQQEPRDRRTAAVAAAATSKTKADAWAYAPDDEYNANCLAVDEWNLPYSATTPDWISMSSSTDTDDLTSKWTMNLSMTSNDFHQNDAIPTTGETLSSTPVQVNPLLPPRSIAKSMSRDRRRRTLTPMNKLPPVKEFVPSPNKLPSGKDSPSSARSSKESSLSDKMRQEEDFVDHIASAFRDHDADLLLESNIEKRWQRAARKAPRGKGANHSFTTLREGSPKSIIDMDNWNNDSRQGALRNAGKRPLLLNKNEKSDVINDSMNVSPSAAAIRKQESFRCLGEEPDDSESLADHRALTRRGRALQPFKSCVKCLLD